MNKIIEKISNISLFDIACASAKEHSFGCNQSWYPTQWQRNSGCGPSCATNMFYYMAVTHPELRIKLNSIPLQPTKESLLALMNDVWDFITPTKMGVNSTSLFVEGSKKYAAAKNILLNCKSINIPSKTIKSSLTFNDFILFISENLKNGFPLAFLNLSNGKLDNLHHWHWVNLISLEEDEDGNYFCLAADEGQKKRLNMKLWFETTTLGGGIVAFHL